MLTGRQLFTGPTAYAVFEKQVKESPAEVDGVPRGLDVLLAELLEKDPERRPADANELFGRLAAFARDLPPLPGYLDEGANPGRMYARVVGRVPETRS